MDDNFYRAEIKFFVDGKKKEFSIIHNIQGGVDGTIDAALTNWQARTRSFADKSFCEYIKSKGVHVAYTEKEFQELNK